MSNLKDKEKEAKMNKAELQSATKYFVYMYSILLTIVMLVK